MEYAYPGHSAPADRPPRRPAGQHARLGPAVADVVGVHDKRRALGASQVHPRRRSTKAMESSDGGDTSDSFLDDRAVSELSECPTSDAGSEPDDAPCVKRRRTDSEDSADEYAPVRVARGLWGCVVVVGLAAPADVRVLVLRDDPGA